MLVAQLYTALYDPMDYSPAGSSLPGIYWSGKPFPSPGDIPNLGIEPGSPALQVVGQKVHSGFSIRLYGKTRTNIMVNLILAESRLSKMLVESKKRFRKDF